MNNLITVDFKQPVKLTGQERVSLRDVWKQLSPAKGNSFHDWAKDNLETFEKDNDFGFLPTIPTKSKGRPAVEYWVTVDCAKDICMLSRTAEGKLVRAYFRACESLVYANGLNTQLTNVPTAVSPEFLRQIADELQFQTERGDRLETQLTLVQQQPTKHAKQYALPSSAIYHGYRKIREAAEAYKAWKSIKMGKSFNDAAWITMYLEQFHQLIPQTGERVANGLYRATFDRADIEAIEAAL